MVDDGNLTFDVGSNTTIASLITGSGDIVQEGSGVLTLSNGNNTFTGGVAVASTLAVATSGVSTSGPLGVGTVTLEAGGTLEATEAVSLTNNFVVGNNGTATIGGGNDVTLSGAGTFYAGGVLSVTDTGNTTLSGSLSSQSGGNPGADREHLGNSDPHRRRFARRRHHDHRRHTAYWQRRQHGQPGFRRRNR